MTRRAAARAAIPPRRPRVSDSPGRAVPFVAVANLSPTLPGVDRSGMGWTILGRYETHQRAAGLAAGTIRLHRYRLTDLADMVASPELVTADLLKSILANPGWKPETRKSVRGVYRSFFGWAHADGHLEHDPAAGLPTVRIPAAVPRPIPEEPLRAGLGTAAEREAFMVELAAYGGLRAGEIARVHQDDWDRWARLLIVWGKGGKVREVPIEHAGLAARLDVVVGWAFPNGRGNHLSPGHVTKLVSRTLPGQWTAHPCRHRMATTAYAGTRDLLAVGALLGHSRPETTQRYVKMPDDALREAARAAAA